MAGTVRYQIEFVGSDGTRTKGPVVVHKPASRKRAVRYFGDEAWTVDQAASRFRRYLFRKDEMGLETAMRALDRLDSWQIAVRRLEPGRSTGSDRGKSLLRCWMALGLSRVAPGLRENLPDLIDAFRRLLPPYAGSGLTLYRGELESRFASGIIGIAWTPNLETARMFARRRVPLGEGQGVVLRIQATTEIIVVALRHYIEHTVNNGEDEYRVDPRLLEGWITVIT